MGFSVILRYLIILELVLETLKIKHHLNHFALKTKLWIKTNIAAFQELQRLKNS